MIYIPFLSFSSVIHSRFILKLHKLYYVSRFKDKTPTPLTNLDMLLEGTYRQVLHVHYIGSSYMFIKFT